MQLATPRFTDGLLLCSKVTLAVGILETTTVRQYRCLPRYLFDLLIMMMIDNDNNDIVMMIRKSVFRGHKVL